MLIKLNMWVVFDFILCRRWLKVTGKAESLKLIFLSGYLLYKIQDLYCL